MQASPTTADGPARGARVWAYAALIAAIWITYWGVLGNGWIFYDDHEYVTDNPHVRAGLTWEGITWFLREFHVGNWHPLTSWSHMLDVELFGLDPRWPHAENLALHAANACLLLHVLFLYSRRFWASALVAALFALHPLRVESVAWIAERKDVLCALFFMLTLWAYHAWTLKRSAGWMVVTTAALALGLLAKPMLVTVPAVLLLLDVWPLARRERFRQRVVEKWPLYAVVLSSVVITLVAQTQSGATSSLQETPPLARSSTVVTAYVRYLAKTFAPQDLALAYPYEYAPDLLFPALSLGFLIVFTIAVVRLRHERPHLWIGWLWYLGMLVPVIGLVQVGSQSHADRYTYLPSIGIALALAFELARFVARRPVWRGPVVASCAVVLVAASALTHAQVGLWRDSRTLFEHTLRVTKNNPTAEKIYGDTLLEEGDYEEALKYYRRALELYPWFPNGRNNWGCALAQLGRFSEAAEQFAQAADIEPKFDVYRNWGSALLDAGRSQEALAPLQSALALSPEDAKTHALLGQAFLRLQRVDDALLHLTRALERTPEDVETRRASANAYGMRGEVELEVGAFVRLLEAAPNDLNALINIALIRSTHPDAAHRNGTEAVRCAEKARDVAGEPISILFGALASAYAEVGRFDEAVTAARRAIALAEDEGNAPARARFETQLVEHSAGRPFRAP